MPVDLDPETATRLIWWMAAFSFLIAIVAAVGEVLGWWALVGELGIGFGTVAGLLLTAIGILSNASTRQVEGVHTAVEENGETLAGIETALVGEEGMVQELDVIQTQLDAQTGVLGEQLTVLSQIRDRIQEVRPTQRRVRSPAPDVNRDTLAGPRQNLHVR